MRGKALRVFAVVVASISAFMALAMPPADSIPPENDTTETLPPVRRLRFMDRHVVGTPVHPDSVSLTRLRKKNFWRAAGETFGFNIGLWAFDRYVVKGQYAYISWHSIKENFRHGFEWDDDYLATNMFNHPYNGSLFYNAGRSNGYNFWQSELFAIGGSAMWELFMEREYPSTNDIIATPIGGAAIGEVLYRTSDLIIDDRSSGAERFGREVAAFVVDPMRGINRIITGRAWKHRAESGRHFGIPLISVDVALGSRILVFHDNNEGTRAGASASVKIEYGDPFATYSRTPYDYFSFYLELQAMKTQPLISRIEIMGRLLQKELVDRHNFNLSMGMYQHFDYFDSDTMKNVSHNSATSRPCLVPYKYGTPASVGGGVMMRYSPFKSWTLTAFGHVNGVLLAGILTDYYRDYNRDYNWGSGFGIKGGFSWVSGDKKLELGISDRFYRIYTWQGYDHSYNWSLTPEGGPVDVQGDQSHASFNYLEVMGSYQLMKRLYVSAKFDMFTRSTQYNGIKKEYENGYSYYHFINSKQLGFHLMLTYKL